MAQNISLSNQAAIMSANENISRAVLESFNTLRSMSVEVRYYRSTTR